MKSKKVGCKFVVSVKVGRDKKWRAREEPGATHSGHDFDPEIGIRHQQALLATDEIGFVLEYKAEHPQPDYVQGNEALNVRCLSHTPPRPALKLNSRAIVEVW